jgi:hypothetical protein
MPMVQVYLSEEEYERFERYAKSLNMPVTRAIKQLAFQALVEREKSKVI